MLNNDTKVLKTEGGYLILDLSPLLIQLGDKVALPGALANGVASEGRSGS